MNRSVEREKSHLSGRGSNGVNTAVLPDPDTMERAFPECDCQHKAFGNNVIVQIRTPRTRSAGGIAYPDESRETEKWNTQVGKVVSIGPLSFKDRDTMKPWPEGVWFHVGDFVRVPKYGGDRWEVPIVGHPDGSALFVLCKELEVGAEVIGDPLKVIAYL